MRYLLISPVTVYFSFLTFRGDYRTGKRLNMRKVIPYIASQFRKDKIWLRRTKPSKRQYQICLAIDDSSSMIDNHSKQVKTNKQQKTLWKDYEETIPGWCICQPLTYFMQKWWLLESWLVVLGQLFVWSMGLKSCDFMPKRLVAKRSVKFNWKKKIINSLDRGLHIHWEIIFVVFLVVLAM